MPNHAPNAQTGKADAPNAGIRQIKPEFVKNAYSDIIYFTHATHVPNDVFAYSRDARHRFDERRYLATITTASAIVEVILNKDSRMQEKRQGWRSLSPKLLKEGAAKGLPVQQLLDADETLPAASIEFVDLRNRVAHGNLRGIVGLEHTGTPDYSSQGRLAALNQLKKAEAFVMEWYNTAPDVQEGKIVHHRWPSGREEGLDK
jgi:hypothetical protein